MPRDHDATRPTAPRQGQTTKTIAGASGTRDTADDGNDRNPAPRRRPQRLAPRRAGDAASVLEALVQLSLSPDADLARIEHLTGVYERLKAREAEAAFGVALASLQAKLPVIDETGVILGPDGEPAATYATWEDTVEAIRPILARHGFSLSFWAGRSAAGLPTVTGVLRHREGHSEEGELELPPDVAGGKNALQAIGSSTAYGQRYVARMLLNITSRGADDDAASAMLSPDAAQALAEIRALPGPTALADWKRRNHARLAALPPSDFRLVVRCYADQLRRVSAPAAEAAA